MKYGQVGYPSFCYDDKLKWVEQEKPISIRDNRWSFLDSDGEWLTEIQIVFGAMW